jgi:peptidoglycan/LPS O-acetylase OafA/YrhL
MGFWVPLSRLTFNAYLVHPIVLTVIFGSIRQPIQYNDVTQAVYAIAAVVLSYGFAAVVAAFIEFPLSNVEATVFKILGFGARESVRQTAPATEPQLPPKEPKHVAMANSSEIQNS